MLRIMVGIVIVAAICTIAVQYGKIQKLTATNIKLETEYTYLDLTLKDEQSKFKHTIEMLENQLNNYVLNEDAYKCSVSLKSEAIDNRAKEEESKITTELQSDSSSDNQLNIARRLLHEFASKNK